MVITFVCIIKIIFLQYTWELQKYKSKYITGKKKSKKTLHTYNEKWAKNDHELMIYIQHDHLRYYSSPHLEVSTDLTGE